MIFFEAPHRTAAALAALAEAFGADRRAAACRELTKTYEEVRRGPLADLLAWADGTEVRGEVTLVVAGAALPGDPESLTDAVEAVLALTRSGTKLKSAAAEIAERTGLAKNLLYDQVIKASRPG